MRQIPNRNLDVSAANRPRNPLLFVPNVLHPVTRERNLLKYAGNYLAQPSIWGAWLNDQPELPKLSVLRAKNHRRLTELDGFILDPVVRSVRNHMSI